MRNTFPPLVAFSMLSIALACASKEETNAGDTGDGDGGGGSGDGDVAGDGDGSGGMGGELSSGSGGAPSFEGAPLRPRRFRIPDPEVVSPPCAAGNGSISAHQVLLGQTHLTPEGWPFQTVSAGRPLTIAVAASGDGAAPAMVVTAALGGEELSICLEGPAELAPDTTDLESATYRGTLPAAWVKPGLTVEVSIGSMTETLSPNVVAENSLTIYHVEAELFLEGTNEETSDALWTEFLARLPFSSLDVATNPFGVWRPEKLLVSPRDDGRTSTGETTTHPAIFIEENPHCSSEDQSAGTCTMHSGYGTMAAVLNTLDTFREANGVGQSSTWYASLGVDLGGGLAGGQRGVGDDSGLVMNHELGHAWGFPHWAADHTDYPYEGVQRDRGGSGNSWAVDQATGLLLSPICDELERQSPMQRAGTCVPDGSWFDPFSDYEAARLLRMNLGASTEVLGDVEYSGGLNGGTTRPYVLPSEGGRQHMVWNEGEPGFTLTAYDEVDNEFVALESDQWNRLAQTEVPVVMFAGAVIVGGESHFEAPLSYVGNVLHHIDPSIAADYASLYEMRSSQFYWASDLHLRFSTSDGMTFTRIYSGEAVLRQAGDHARFAMNLPAALGETVQKVEVLSRPLGHYTEESRLDDTVTAENYFTDAVVLGTWEK